MRTRGIATVLTVLSSVLLFAATPAASADAEPVLTEFMASNSTNLADGFGLFPDWIELHNPADHPIDLAGWQLTDETDHNPTWTFPSTMRSTTFSGLPSASAWFL